MSMKKTINKAEKYLLHTYNRYSVVLDHGKGVYLYDTEGKKYLDFGAGIAVCALGYGNKKYTKALKKQVDKLMHVSNLFYTEPLADAAKGLTKVTGMDRVFLSNSGTEAIEGAIKLARKYALKKGYEGRSEIISMNKAFHGRSMGALSVTGTEKYRTPFEPLISGVKFAEYNDLDSVKALVSDKTCAIILEPLQGEGGIHPTTKEFMQGIRELCTAHDMLMICDEIQCGMGRSGSMFVYEKLGVKPDVVTLAKGIGCGTTVGAFAMTEEASIGLEAGDHGTTFGGNPFAATSVKTVLKIFEEEDILDNVNAVGSYLEEKLEELVQNKKTCVAHRGMGLMQGLELTIAPGDVVAKALEKGLILISAGGNVIRFIPPLVIKKKHVDEMIAILDSIIE